MMPDSDQSWPRNWDRAVTGKLSETKGFLTIEEVLALQKEVEELREVSERYENVMDTLNVEYEDMFPEEEDD